MKYEKPIIEIMEADLVLLQSSELGPGATDIFAPNVDNNSKSVWDEEESDNTLLFNKEEQDYEDWI